MDPTRNNYSWVYPSSSNVAGYIWWESTSQRHYLDVWFRHGKVYRYNVPESYVVGINAYLSKGAAVWDWLRRRGIPGVIVEVRTPLPRRRSPKLDTVLPVKPLPAPVSQKPRPPKVKKPPKPKKPKKPPKRPESGYILGSLKKFFGF